MNKRKSKLELNWIGKERKPKLEDRILINNNDLSYSNNKKANDILNNKLIFGDNLLALKAIENEYFGKIKCIYIDPPYNTGNAFEYYDDGLENSIWLSLIRDRLEILWKLLRQDGYLAVQIDDNQFARLYILMSELFGEKNLKTICVKMSEATGVKMASIKKIGGIPKLKEYIILAGKNGIRGLKVDKIPKSKWDKEYNTFIHGATKEELELIKQNLEDEERSIEKIEQVNSILKNISFEGVGEVCLRECGNKFNQKWLFENSWRIIQFATLTGGAKNLAVNKKLNLKEKIPAFSIITPTKKMYIIKRDFNHESKKPRCKFLFADQYLEIHPGDFWSDIKTTGLDNEGGVKFKNGKKPEKLLERIIKMCSNPGDLVLDSFAGSGTTGAVAHKLRRKWIMIELGEHCHTHIIPRLKNVIDGKDNGGITKNVNWSGGGGFKYFKLAPSMIEKDKWGNPIISKKYNSKMLSEAMCKHMGFNYSPNESNYWIHGKSSETDFIYITSNAMTYSQLSNLSKEVNEGKTLLVCCKAFNAEEDAFSNLTLKKIPQSILSKCEWGKDDYSLNIENYTNKEDEIDG